MSRRSTSTRSRTAQRRPTKQGASSRAAAATSTADRVAMGGLKLIFIGLGVIVLGYAVLIELLAVHR